ALAARAWAVRHGSGAALEDGAYRERDGGRRRWVLVVAEAADEPEPWRRQVRAAVRRGDVVRLKQLAARVAQAEPTPGTALLLAKELGDDEAGTRLLAQMQERQPQDFWVNFLLADLLDNQKQYGPAVACWQIVRALRPQSSAVHSNLGLALHDKGDFEGAIRSYHQAIRLDPKFAMA